MVHDKNLVFAILYLMQNTCSGIAKLSFRVNKDSTVNKTAENKNDVIFVQYVLRKFL